MSGVNVATVLNRCAGRLPVAPPNSARRRALEATALRNQGQLRCDHGGCGHGRVGAGGAGGSDGTLGAASRGTIGSAADERRGGDFMDEGVTAGAGARFVSRIVRLIAAHYQPLGIIPDGVLDGHVAWSRAWAAPAARVAR